MWEYKSLYITDHVFDKLDEKLNKLGNEGWELVGMTQFSNFSVMYIFKRKKKKS